MSMTWKLNTAGQVLRIGFRTPGFKDGLELPGKMRLAAELGMSVLEAQQAEHDVATPEIAREMVRAAAEYKIEIPSMGVILPLSEPNSHAAVQTKFAYALEIAKALGASYVLTASRFPPDDVPQPQAWSLVVENLKRCAEAAQRASVTLALEPEWFHGSAERMERVLRLVNHPNLRPNFDPANLYMYGSDALEAYDRFAPSVLSGHIKDGVCRGGKHWEVELGKGELDWPALIKQFIARGRSLNLFIEHCQSGQAVRAAAGYIKKVIDDAWAPSR